MPNRINNIKSFFETIFKWYDKYGRNFSWRKLNPSAYEILISEILLRRTMAERVEEIYKNLIKKYPTSKSLENADKEDIIKIIDSLGLKNRCESLIEAAKYLNRNSNYTLDSLKKVNGVGDYISGAFFIFYKGKSIPIIDSNIKRVFKRYFKISTGNEIKAILKQIPDSDAKKFYYGIIDFGALICKPKQNCLNCFLLKTCLNKLN